MFNATKFNCDIYSWDVSNVKIMTSLFASSNFNQDISSWDISNVIIANNMFNNNKSFSQDNANKLWSKWGNYILNINHVNMFKDSIIDTTLLKNPDYY